MRMRLRAGDTAITPERALQAVELIQHHRVSINGAPPLSGVSSMTPEHNQMLKVSAPIEYCPTVGQFSVGINSLELSNSGGLSSITQEHAGILSALTIKKPSLETQLTLL